MKVPSRASITRDCSESVRLKLKPLPVSIRRARNSTGAPVLLTGLFAGIFGYENGPTIFCPYTLYQTLVEVVVPPFWVLNGATMYSLTAPALVISKLALMSLPMRKWVLLTV